MFAGLAVAQTLRFEVASVKASESIAGGDYNNQLLMPGSGIVGRNVTLRRLVAEAYRVQQNQVIGPRWIDEAEYDLQAQTGSTASRGEMAMMLRALLAERFHLRQHGENRTMRAYELTAAKGGPKIHPVSTAQADHASHGFRFRGEMGALADLIAVQFTIPTPTDPTKPAMGGGPPPIVIDRTGLLGTYEFDVDIRLEADADAVTLWQRFLEEQLGLKIESRRSAVPVVVIDSADRVPTAN